MTNASHTIKTTPSFEVSVAKSDVAGLLSLAPDVGLDGDYVWPIAPRALAMLYRSSPEHSRSIHVKAEGAFGQGLAGEAGPLERICAAGSTELFVALGVDLETYGNAFCQIIRDTSNRLVGLRRLPAITMRRRIEGYAQITASPNGALDRTEFDKSEILHLREQCPEGRMYSLPTWIGVEGMLALSHAATRYNASFFNNNAMPEYAVIFKGATPSEKTKDAIKEFFRNEHQGVDNAHRTLLLNTTEDGSVDIKRLTSEVKDGDFLKLIDAARDRIPTAHGVPPRILGIMAAGQLGGGGEVEGQLFVFEHLTLKPRRRRMLEQFRPILTELGLAPGVLTDGLDNGQVAFRELDLTPPNDDAEHIPDWVGAGIVSPEEARSLIPALVNAKGRAVERSAPQSAPANPIEALAALLARS